MGTDGEEGGSDEGWIAGAKLLGNHGDRGLMSVSGEGERRWRWYDER